MSFIVLLQSEYFTAVTIDRDRLITALCGTSDRAARVKYILYIVSLRQTSSFCLVAASAFVTVITVNSGC